MHLPTWLNHLAELCYPSICSLCDASADALPLCSDCVASLERLEAAPACDRCGYPLPDAVLSCPRCHGRGMAPLDRIIRLGVFHDPLRGLVHRLKYRNGWPLAEYLAGRLAAHEPARGLLTESDCLVAIPLHPLRQMSRGYNQAGVIAERIGKLCSIATAHPIARLRNTQTQTNIHAHARRVANLRDAFGLIDERAVRGRHVVLVDDVMTSGATLISAARTLQKALPASLSAITLAVADPKGRSFEAI